MSTAGRRFINEGVLRIAWFIIFTSLTYTVRNYTWAIVLLMVVAVYSLVTGIIMLTRQDRDRGRA
ncbi:MULTISPECIES: hypothetical protein [Paenibacillus]|jgi:hypothetical protein|uniref:Uncharacterized protein n=1 Tax=Paenibacillus phytohabitans TaxID=2654978 RepID=A0ABX1YDU2_9BACL|nr:MULTISPECIES: hypothetical protein [Paenibacillus]AIQ30543.1 hypothetical protein P40081_22035 [Paenibacillus sp. FSL P4-0081]KHL91817.1 hypothetical protein QW71_32460 [Paenibacillus sp. IHB B 3415]NOU77959.1 hypothetical protein [Paenibacillus phytohabitans]OMF23687.1 hypothetical protein BK132_26650 [Paenibacillus sp. FSL H8-0259]